MKPDVIETVPLVQDDGTRVYVQATPDVVTPPTVRVKADAPLNHGVPHLWTPECEQHGCFPIMPVFNRVRFDFEMPPRIDWGTPLPTAQDALAKAHQLAGNPGVKMKTIAELMDEPSKPMSPMERDFRANPVNGSKPREFRACEKCVYGRGEHAKWCRVK